jgi:hypothetical protein
MNKLRLLLNTCVALCLLTGTVSFRSRAQDDPKAGGDTPAAPADKANESAKKDTGKDAEKDAKKADGDDEEAPAAEPETLEIAFRLDGLMFTDVSVAGSTEKYNFLIDSGATSCVLGEHLAELLGIDTQDSPVQAQGVGTADTKLATNVDFGVGDSKWTSKMAIVTDLSAIADQSGVWMDGILGHDWLLQFKTVEFDFAAKKAKFVKWEEGKGKKTLQDALGGLGGMFGGGGTPDDSGDTPAKKAPKKKADGEKKSDDKKPAEKPKKPDGKEDDYSAGELERERSLVAMQMFAQISLPLMDGSYVRTLAHSIAAQKADDKKPADAAKADAAKSAHKLESMDVKFKLVEATLPIFDSSLVIVDLYFVDMTIDGKKAKMIFDTGASSLLVLDRKFADKIDLGHSFTFPVTGLGQGIATMGVVNDFKFGTHRETRENPAIILDLEKTFGQFEQMRSMMDNPLFKMMGLELPTPVGLAGLPFAMRYRSMKVDYETGKMHFTAYENAPKPSDGGPGARPDPTEGDAFMLTATKNSWAGKAGDWGFESTPLPIEDWKEKGIKGGLVVDSVTEGGAAETAGIAKGDIVYEFLNDIEPQAAHMGDLPQSKDAPKDGAKEPAKDPAKNPAEKPEFVPLRGAAEASMIAAFAGKGRAITVKVKKKDGTEKTLTVTLGAIKDDVKTPKRYAPAKDAPAKEAPAKEGAK